MVICYKGINHRAETEGAAGQPILCRTDTKSQPCKLGLFGESRRAIQWKVQVVRDSGHRQTAERLVGLAGERNSK